MRGAALCISGSDKAACSAFGLGSSHRSRTVLRRPAKVAKLPTNFQPCFARTGAKELSNAIKSCCLPGYNLIDACRYTIENPPSVKLPSVSTRRKRKSTITFRTEKGDEGWNSD